MNACDRHERHDPFATLNLSRAVYAQALKRLVHIAEARCVRDCERAAAQAEGFGLGLETLKALSPATLEVLFLVFDHAATARLLELEQ